MVNRLIMSAKKNRSAFIFSALPTKIYSAQMYVQCNFWSNTFVGFYHVEIK